MVIRSIPEMIESYKDYTRAVIELHEGAGISDAANPGHSQIITEIQRLNLAISGLHWLSKRGQQHLSLALPGSLFCRETIDSVIIACQRARTQLTERDGEACLRGPPPGSRPTTACLR